MFDGVHYMVLLHIAVFPIVIYFLFPLDVLDLS